MLRIVRWIFGTLAGLLAAGLSAPLKGTWRWFDDRAGISRIAEPMLKHPVPPETAAGKFSWMYVLGTATLSVFILQVVTGAVLATKYVPSTAHAYDSLRFITGDVVFGGWLRGTHFFGASAMVLLMVLHAARVFLTGSYKFPRELGWISGVLLLGLTMAMAFSGQLLRWNQDGVWAVVVAAHFAARVPLVGPWLGEFILGGDMVGGTTLSRFYAFHVFLLPAFIFLLIGFHLYLVFQNGISEVPRAGEPVDPKTYRARYDALLKRSGRPYWPDALWAELAAGAAVVAAVLVLAFVFGPRPLGDPPDPTALAADPRPDWFLIWYYALLAVKPRGLEDLFMVHLPLLAGFFLILLPLVANRGERSPARRPWAVAAVGGAALTLITLLGLGYQRPWVPEFQAGVVSVDTFGPVDESVARGAELFDEKGCNVCHAVAGLGGSWGPDLTDVTKRLSHQDISVRIVAGFRDMPSYRDNLTTEELNALLAFLQAAGRPRPRG